MVVHLFVVVVHLFVVVVHLFVVIVLIGVIAHLVGVVVVSVRVTATAAAVDLAAEQRDADAPRRVAAHVAADPREGRERPAPVVGAAERLVVAPEQTAADLRPHSAGQREGNLHAVIVVSTVQEGPVGQGPVGEVVFVRMALVEVAEGPELAARRQGHLLGQPGARQGLDVRLLELEFRRFARMRTDAQHDRGAQRIADIARQTQLAVAERESLGRTLALVPEFEPAGDVRIFGRMRGEHAPQHRADLGSERFPMIVAPGHLVVVAVIVRIGRLAGSPGLQRFELLLQRPDAGLVFLPEGRNLDGENGSHGRVAIRLCLCLRRHQRRRNGRGRGGGGNAHGTSHI